MRKLFALAALLVLTVSICGCESCSLFHGERARQYPAYAPACGDPGCGAPCTQCAPGYVPAGGCPSCSAPTVSGVSTTVPMPVVPQTSPAPST